jgi:hypothetical protein
VLGVATTEDICDLQTTCRGTIARRIQVTTAATTAMERCFIYGPEGYWERLNTMQMQGSCGNEEGEQDRGRIDDGIMELPALLPLTDCTQRSGECRGILRPLGGEQAAGHTRGCDQAARGLEGRLPMDDFATVAGGVLAGRPGNFLFGSLLWWLSWRCRGAWIISQACSRKKRARRWLAAG